MNTSVTNTFFTIGAFCILLFLGCQNKLDDCQERISYSDIDLNDHLNIDSLYSPPDSVELNNIKSAWNDFNYKSDSFNITTELSYAEGRKIQIIEHYSNEQRHYGAILLPKNYVKSEKYPVLVWASGLNQKDPTVNINGYPNKKIISNFQDYFIAFPSFRGQALILNQNSYCQY